MERKEQMETKMLNTFEVKTTAVTCPKVKIMVPFNISNNENA